MHEYREQWLKATALAMSPKFKELGYDLPDFRISCGFPSRNATARRNRATGQCWQDTASEDKHYEIFISPVIDDVMDIAATIAHELVHAVMPPNTGHKGKFPATCKALGLDGKPTSTSAGEAFKQWCKPILDSIGDYPHARLNVASKPKAQGTRMIKCMCEQCGYTVRTTAKWLEQGAPLCPTHETEMVH